MAEDPHRPRCHFVPGNWMNDPIPFYADGLYHVFFQHNPYAACWARMHWGHAVSRDLVHWKLMPLALVPTPGGPDAEGCWTGSVIRHGERFFAFYTGIPSNQPFAQVQCMATSSDLVSWHKHPAPVIAAPPTGFGESGDCFRDPQLVKFDGAWHMIIGAELPGREGGAALLYRAASDDLTRWDYLHLLCTSPAVHTGYDFECPDFFPLARSGGGIRHVLLSSRHRSWYQLGSFEELAFDAEAYGPLDGETFYAAKTCQDSRGRRICFGWIREARPVEEQRKAGWSGVLSLPRLLELDAAGELRMRPVPELAMLRGMHLQHQGMKLTPGRHVIELSDRPGGTYELSLRLRPPARLVLTLLASSDGKRGLPVALDREAGTLGEAPFTLGADEPLELRVFVDHSVVEIFANSRTCLTLRTYDRLPFDRRLGLWTSHDLRLDALEMWDLQSL